jgi:hypothetical protein
MESRRPGKDGDTAMIGILTAVVVVVGVAVAADLLLSFAVIRRLAALQSRMRAGAGSGGAPVIGHRVGDFRVELLTGGVFTLADLRDARAMVVFLTTTCEPCETAVAELRALPIPLPSTLYVLISGTGQGGDVLAVATDMPAGAHVGEIPASDAAIQAFGIDGFPTMLTIEDGIVRTSGFRVSSLLEHAGQ